MLEPFTIHIKYDMEIDWDNASQLTVIRSTCVEYWLDQVSKAGGEFFGSTDKLNVGLVNIVLGIEGTNSVTEMIEVSGLAFFPENPETD